MSGLLHDPSQPLDLKVTFTCGQIFRWRQQPDGWWLGTLGRTALAVRQSSPVRNQRTSPKSDSWERGHPARMPAPAERVDGPPARAPRKDASPPTPLLEVRQAGQPLSAEQIARFLALDVDLRRVYRRIGTDRHLRAATMALPGLRILRQEPWECLASFICSAWNNIPKIEGSTSFLCRRWGEPLTLDLEGREVTLYSFPAAERLASATEAELREAALGFRAPNLLRAARLVAEGGLDMEALRRAAYDEALRALRGVPGVGRKVADCILLFSLDQPEAFPVDVWVWRVMQELYGKQLAALLPEAPPAAGAGPSDRAYRAIQEFAWRRWGRCAGYAQQYLFTAKRWGLV